MKPSFAIIGTGAIGGLYGGLLAHHSQDVHFLSRSNFKSLKENGLWVKSLFGDFHLKKINVYRRVEEMPACDYLVICLKSQQNSVLPKLLPSLLKNSSTLLTLQNGFGIEEELHEWFPNHGIMGGLCFVCSNKTSPSHIHHLDYGMIKFGSYNCNPKTLNIVSQYFSESNINISIADSLRKARWEKLVWNIPFNGLSVVLKADTHEIMQNVNHRKRAEILMQEVLMAAKSDNVMIEPSFVQKMLDNTSTMKPYKTSMVLDYENGVELELKYMYQKPLELALSNGIQLPLIQNLLNELLELDNKNPFKKNLGPAQAKS